MFVNWFQFTTNNNFILSLSHILVLLVLGSIENFEDLSAYIYIYI